MEQHELSVAKDIILMLYKIIIIMMVIVTFYIDFLWWLSDNVIGVQGISSL